MKEAKSNSDINDIINIRKMSQMFPVSLSLADFKEAEKSCAFPRRFKHHRNYLPPDSKVKVIKNEPIKSPTSKNNRFSFLTNNQASSPKKVESKDNIKLDYKLPNVEIIKTPHRGRGHQLMVVSLSNLSLSEQDDSLENKSDHYLSPHLNQSTKNGNNIFNELATQIPSNGSSESD